MTEHVTEGGGEAAAFSAAIGTYSCGGGLEQVAGNKWILLSSSWGT